jgi:hypothetical protein
MRCWWNLLTVGFVTCVLGTASCGGDDDARETPYEEFAGEYADVFCSELAPCCTLVPFSVEECKSFMGFFVVLEAAAARENKFVFHPDLAEQCLADVRAQGLCTGIEPESCRRVTEGKVAGGGACESSAECPSSERASSVCSLDGEGRGVCRFPGRAGAVGEACAGNCDGGRLECGSDVAGMDTFCYRDTGLTCTAGTCQALAAIGAPCSGFDSCVDGATCSGGVCLALAGLGGACSSSSECRDEHYCAAGACAARLPSGSACDDTADSCLNGTCMGGRCSDFLLEFMCAFGALE